MTSRIIETVRRRSALALPLVLVALGGCGNDGVALTAPKFEALQPPSNHNAAKVGPGPIATVASFDAFSGQLPESIAVDRHGNIYVSMPSLGEIWKLDPSGSFEEVVATFPLEGFFGVIGLRFDVRGDLYAVQGTSNEDVHGIWKITPGGEKMRIAGTGNIVIPNDVAISPDGTLYITDSAGSVWRALPGQPALMWVQDEALEGTGAYGLGFPLGANGIVAVQGGLMVSNAEKGQLVFVPILPNGSAGQPTVVVAHPGLFGLDGITADAQGTIYGAVNVGNKVVRISRDGADASEIASGAPLDFPTAVAFGAGSERHTLFIVNFAFIHFLSDPPMPGNANPAVLAVPIGAPGLSSR
jgi:sugar lactone lactonase YvrE